MAHLDPSSFQMSRDPLLMCDLNGASTAFDANFHFDISGIDFLDFPLQDLDVSFPTSPPSQSESDSDETPPPYLPNSPESKSMALGGHPAGQGSQHQLPIGPYANSPLEVPGMPKKRAAHNVIEKRYRHKLNDLVNELQILLPPPDTTAKLQKPAVLSKAITYIQKLKSDNEELQRRLRQFENPQSYVAQGVRLTACMMVCGFMMFGLPSNSEYSPSGPSGEYAHHGRTLQSTTSASETPSLIPASSLLLSLLRTFLIIVGVSFVFYHEQLSQLIARRRGVTDEGVSAMFSQSKDARAQGNFSEARSVSQKGLASQNFSLPASSFLLVLQVMFYSMLEMLNILLIGRVLAPIVQFLSGAYTPVSALLFHEFNQTTCEEDDSTEPLSDDSLNHRGLEIMSSALRASHIAESCKTSLPSAHYVEINLSMAVQAQLNAFSVLSRVYYRRAEKTFVMNRENLSDSEVAWFFTEEGKAFFFGAEWQHEGCTALRSISHAFRNVSLDRAYETLVSGSPLGAVAHSFTLLADNSRRAMDSDCMFYSHAGVVLTHLQAGAPPPSASLEIVSLAANDSRKKFIALSLEAQMLLRGGRADDCLARSKMASDLLSSHSFFTSSVGDNTTPSRATSALLLAMRQLYFSRIGVCMSFAQLEAQRGKEAATSLKRAILQDMNKDLRVLRVVADSCHAAEPMVHLHEALNRAFCGANVKYTEYLLLESIKAAQQQRMAYDEGLGLLSLVALLGDSLTPAAKRQHTLKAIGLFNRITGNKIEDFEILLAKYLPALSAL